jgi:hypothetical protein
MKKVGSSSVGFIHSFIHSSMNARRHTRVVLSYLSRGVCLCLCLCHAVDRSDPTVCYPMITDPRRRVLCS